jgi:hypothetical protein
MSMTEIITRADALAKTTNDQSQWGKGTAYATRDEWLARKLSWAEAHALSDEEKRERLAVQLRRKRAKWYWANPEAGRKASREHQARSRSTPEGREAHNAYQLSVVSALGTI